MQWQGKTVLVTGGSAGLGKAIAAAFARAGATVGIGGRDEEKLKLAAEELRAAGANIKTFRADVGDDDEVTRLFAEVREHFGRLDALVNNVGRSSRGAVQDVSPEQFQELWEVNFLTAVRCTRAAMPLLLAAKGHVVNIGSLSAKTASPFLAAYSASKFPLAAYSQQLRLELGEQGLHVLLVCPGPIARDDANVRYANQAAGLPASAAKPGGGVQIKALDPAYIATRIVSCCERRQAELVIPWKARLLFALSALWPAWGDALVRRNT